MHKTEYFVSDNAAFAPFVPRSSRLFWRWGNDNLLPLHLARIALRSAVHRRIIADKADYIAGKGLTCDPANRKLRQWTEQANGRGESLRTVVKKLAADKCLFGNAFAEVVVDPGRRFPALYHQDASRCRLARDGKHVLLHHDWEKFTEKEAVRLPLYPALHKGKDGMLHALLHLKDYEPGFEHYGVPHYIAGLDASVIAYKTDRWNIARLDNAFQLSGVMILDGDTDTEEGARQLSELVNRKFAGKPGQVMYIVKNAAQNENSKFIPLNTGKDGDWKQLHEQSAGDLVVAHSWYRTLSGLNYTSGFSAERILYEYQIALSGVIEPQQRELIEPLKRVAGQVLRVETDSLAFVNRPPVTVKPAYMKVWEARKADGYDFDPRDPQQQSFLSSL